MPAGQTVRMSPLLSCGDAILLTCSSILIQLLQCQAACRFHEAGMLHLGRHCACDHSTWLQADARAAQVEAQLQASQQQAEVKAAAVEAQLHSQQQLLGGVQVQLQEVGSRQGANDDLPQLWAAKLEAMEVQLQGQVGCCYLNISMLAMV